MKFRNLFILTIMSATLGIAACTRSHSPEERANWMVSKLSSKLDLNTDQKAKLEDVKKAMLDLRREHEGDRAQKFAEMKQMILSDKLNAAKVKSMMTERQKFMDENFDKIFPKVADFHASLTPEQKQKAVDMIEKFAKHWNGD